MNEITVTSTRIETQLLFEASTIYVTLVCESNMRIASDSRIPPSHYHVLYDYF
jgi:hypothetical protein